MLVGDLVQSVREAITDQPQTMQAPTSVSGVGTTDVNGTLPPGDYFLVVTALNQWGETSPSTEAKVTLTGGQNAISLTFAGPPGHIGSFRVYSGFTASGQENLYIPFTNTFSSPVLITGFVNAPAGTPPARNSAYLPDTDGDAVSAYTMFRWINDALKIGSQVCGGLLDYAGVPSVVGAPQYIVPGTWKKISSMWYDGYPLAMDDNGNYFRRNAITASVLSSVSISTFNNQMMFELWPQPARSAALTTLANPLIVGQLTATLVSTADFLLTNGFVLIGTEIMSYSGLAGNVLSNLQRGLGGTTQAQQDAESFVRELNLFWSGWRDYAPNFQPGSSAQTVPVPVGWETILFEYGLGRMKLAEQNVGDYSKLTEMCRKNFSDWLRANKVVVGPRQIGDQTSGLETLPNLGGGWVVPSIIIINILPKRFDIYSAILYALVLGGLLWTNRNSFMRSVTRVLARFATWASRLTQGCAGRTTCLKGVFTTEQKGNGRKDLDRRIYFQLSRFLKNALCKIGGIEKRTGLIGYERKDISCLICPAVEMVSGFKTAENNQRKLEQSLGKLTSGNFLTLKCVKDTPRAFVIGRQNCHLRRKRTHFLDWKREEGLAHKE